MRNSSERNYTFTITQYWHNKLYKQIGQITSEKLVFLALSEKLKKEVVIKILKGSIDKNQKYLERENQIVLMLMKLANQKKKCCNVVEFYEVFQEKGDTFLVMEKCDGILDIKIEYQEKSVLYILQQIVNGYIQLLEVFGPKFIHRDLKPENILKVGDKYKIADFGYSRQMIVDDLTGNIGTHNYIAPEVLKNQQYSNQCDVYSLGKIIYFLLQGEDAKQINLASISNTYLRALIRQMLQKDPNQRITWQELRYHDFMEHNHESVLDQGHIDVSCFSVIIPDFDDSEDFEKLSFSKFLDNIKLLNQNQCQGIEKINQINSIFTQIFKQIEKSDEQSIRLLFTLWIKLLDTRLQKIMLLQKQDQPSDKKNLETLNQILEIISVQQLIRIKNKNDHSIEFMDIEELCDEIQKKNLKLDENRLSEEFNQILLNPH